MVKTQHLLHHKGPSFSPLELMCCIANLPPQPLLKLWKPPLSSIIVSFQQPYINGIIQYVFFWDELFSPSIFLQSFIRWHVSIVHPFPWLSSIPWHGLTKCSFIEGHLGHSIWAPMNKAATYNFARTPV